MEELKILVKQKLRWDLIMRNTEQQAKFEDHMMVVWHPFSRFYLILSLVTVIIQLILWIGRGEENTDIYVAVNIFFNIQILAVL